MPTPSLDPASRPASLAALTARPEYFSRASETIQRIPEALDEADAVVLSTRFRFGNLKYHFLLPGRLLPRRLGFGCIRFCFRHHRNPVLRYTCSGVCGNKPVCCFLMCCTGRNFFV